MKRFLNGSTVVFVLGLLVLGGLVGACSGKPANNSGSVNQTGGTNLVPSTVNVSTTEMAFHFDPMPTQAGRITFVVTNNGKIEHNFALQANGREYATKMIAPGGSESLTIDLAPGTYSFVCGVFGHNFAGMQGSFTLS